MSRRRSHGRAQRLLCGCTHDDAAWIQICAPHAAEIAEVRARWAADHAPRLAESVTAALARGSIPNPKKGSLRS